MGCTSALVDSGDVMTCNSQSYLVDGCSPDIDTSTSDWASSCDSLTTVHLSGDTLSVSSYRTFHIIVDLPYNSSIQWVHIGDVRFLSEGGGPTTGTCLPSFVSAMAPQLSSSSSLTDRTSSSFSSLSLSSTCECYEIERSAVSEELMQITSTIQKPLPTSVAGERGNDCTCRDTCSEETSTVIAVSAVSLLLIVTLTTVTLTQCLLIIRMRRSRDRSETYAEATNSTTKTTDVPVSLNEAYGMTKITTEEVTYEMVK